jgi:hypothetical protein
MICYGNFVEATGKLAEQLNFVSKALGNDAERPVLHNILIEKLEPNGNEFMAIATDGMRMHIVSPLTIGTNKGLKKGFGVFCNLHLCPGIAWLAKISKPNFEIVKYMKAIPTGKPNFKEVFELGFTGKLLGQGKELWKAISFVNSFPEPAVINPQLLADLDYGEWAVSWYGKNKAVVFEKDNYKAIIMPIAT